MLPRFFAALCVLGLVCGSNVASADTIVTFDFETLDPGPTGGPIFAADGGVSLTLSRFFGGSIDVVDLGFDPGSALDLKYGSRSLSPFGDTSFDPWVLEVSGTPVMGESLIGIEWSMGDYLGSDIDGLFLESGSSAGVLNGFVPIDHMSPETDGSFGSFGSFEGSVSRVDPISYFVFSAGNADAENSMFIDNVRLLFSDTPGIDLPISGGGGFTGADFMSVSTSGADGRVGAANPVPEPGTWLLLSCGLVAFAVRRLRKRA